MQYFEVTFQEAKNMLSEEHELIFVQGTYDFTVIAIVSITHTCFKIVYKDEHTHVIDETHFASNEKILVKTTEVIWTW